MRRSVCGPLLLALLVACGKDEPLDTQESAVIDDEPDPCVSLELDYEGPEAPVIGDSWTVWLRCDGSTLVGATVVRFDPPDFGTIDGNVVTFVKAGSATLRVQVGAYREETTVTVSEP